MHALESQAEMPCTLLDDAAFIALLESVNAAPAAAAAKWPQELNDFLTVVELQLKRDGVANADSRARGVVIALSHFLGGRYRYLPKAEKIRGAYDDIDIYKEWARTGDVAALLQKNPSITSRRIYQIIAEQRGLNKKTQQQLFGATA